MYPEECAEFLGRLSLRELANQVMASTFKQGTVVKDAEAVGCRYKNQMYASHPFVLQCQTIGGVPNAAVWSIHIKLPPHTAHLAN